MVRIMLMVAVLAVLSSCRQKSPGESGEAGTEEDAVIAFQPAIIDSVFSRYGMDQHLKEAKAFYESEKYHFVWISEELPNEPAARFLELLEGDKLFTAENRIKQVRMRARLRELSTRMTDLFEDLETPGHLYEFEALATACFFDYAQRNWQGVSEEDSRYTNWKIQRKKIDINDLLISFLNDHRAFKPPVYPQYFLLEEKLSQYLEAAKADTLDWPDKADDLKEGDSSATVAHIKERLFLFGDLEVKDSSGHYDEALTDAVRRFQRRHGLDQTGRIGPKTYDELKVPVAERVEQIVLNMERFRWFPDKITSDYLVVNIPEFRLWVFAQGKLDWMCNVIVGKPSTRSVIFNDTLETIVFSPYWNVPQSIIANEILPAIRRNPGYLASHNMEVVNQKGRPVSAASINWSGSGRNFPYIVRQRPGATNSLGHVKFLFPNRYDMYLHDTPTRSLFAKEFRAYSHGCIRVEEPLKLAEFILRDEKNWSHSKIVSRMHSGKQSFHPVKNRMPVFIAYFTSWVDPQGELNFRKDVYGHDDLLKEILFY